MRILSDHARWRSFDPRRGADRRYDLEEAGARSSLNDQCWIIEGPNSDWDKLTPILENAMAITADEGFMLYVPWRDGPLVSRLASGRLAPLIQTELGISIGASSVQGIAGKVLTLRRQLGGDRSGLWAFGSTRSFSELTQRVIRCGEAGKSPTFAVAAAMDTLGCALAFDDGADTLFLRISARAEPLVTQLEDTIRTTFAADIKEMP